MVAHAAKFQGQSALLSQELLSYYREISQSALTVVDLETTGSLSHNARAIEVSILQASLEDGIQQQQTYLINPGVRIPPFITKITGITSEMIAPAPTPGEVWPLCRPLLEQGTLTAHNLEFDYGFLQSEFKRLKSRFYRPPLKRFCTVQLSRLLLADLPSRSLPNLVKHFGFDISTSHRAEADTRACWLLAQRLLSQIQQEPDDVILQRFGQQWIRLQDAAKILSCRKAEAQQQLTAAGVEQRLSQRSKLPLYRRWRVEQMYYQRQGQQLSLL